MNYGQALLDELTKDKTALVNSANEREARIAAAEVEATDCYLSIWANQVTQQITDLKVAILKNGGMWGFNALADLDGNIVSTRLIQTKFGFAYNVNGTWINAALTEKHIKAKGYQYTTVQRPAWVSKGGHVFESDTNYWTGETVNKGGTV